jgi:hypothetical protein
MSNVAKVEPRQDIAIPQDTSVAMFSMIERAARDPAVDIDKLERLMLMQERAIARQAKADYDAAMATMQPELPSIGERGKVTGRYTYAKWEDINQVIKPVLAKHGFALTFRADTSDGIKVTGGHREETEMTLPADPSGNKPAVQAVASSVSYGKRYTAGALLNLTSHGEDDDGFLANGPQSFDPTDWLQAIEGAMDMVEMNRLREQIRDADIPASPLKLIRASWSRRAAELKAPTA